MQVSNAPLKWLIPWAQQNTNIFELPETTSDPTRASQSMGFPAQTMLPPEAGGVPPQGIDFNAGVYQIARITWWLMYGAPFIYDATFATNSAISGYAQGAEVSATDYLGKWLSLADNNQAAPDTTGTNWVPVQAYGSTSTTLTNANVTLTPLQAMKKTLIFTGTLTGNVVVTLPAWKYDWSAINQCSGAFTLTLTTSGGSGAVVPQGGATSLRGDGTNINYDAKNVPLATTSTQAPQLGQINNRIAIYTAGGSYTVPAGITQIWVSGCAGGAGGGGGGGATNVLGTGAGGGGGGAGQAVIQRLITVTPGQVLTVVIGTAGSAGGAGIAGSTAATAGGNGTSTTLTGTSVSLTLTGGTGGNPGVSFTNAGIPSGGGGGSGAPQGGSGFDGSTGFNGGVGGGGMGASGPFGGGGGNGRGGATGTPGQPAGGAGGGGGGGGGGYGTSSGGSNGGSGGAASAGVLYIEW